MCDGVCCVLHARAVSSMLHSEVISSVSCCPVCRTHTRVHEFDVARQSPPSCATYHSCVLSTLTPWSAVPLHSKSFRVSRPCLKQTRRRHRHRQPPPPPPHQLPPPPPRLIQIRMTIMTLMTLARVCQTCARTQPSRTRRQGKVRPRWGSTSRKHRQYHYETCSAAS